MGFGADVDDVIVVVAVLLLYTVVQTGEICGAQHLSKVSDVTINKLLKLLIIYPYFHFT